MKKINYRNLLNKKIPIGVVGPALLVFVFFVLTIFSFLLPYMEEALMDKKRETIYELVSITHSSIRLFEKKEKSGELTIEHAQRMALDYIRGMRYGNKNENYFWVHDMVPKMLVHKSKNIEGQLVKDFKEPIFGGRAIFMETTSIAAEKGEGFIDYYWGDSDGGSVPVVSYFRIFEPWKWVVGTHISFVDIYVEINQILNRVKTTTMVILGIIFLLLGYNIWSARRRK